MEPSIALETTTASSNSSIPLSVVMGCTRFPFYKITSKQVHTYHWWQLKKSKQASILTTGDKLFRMEFITKTYSYLNQLVIWCESLSRFKKKITSHSLCGVLWICNTDSAIFIQTHLSLAYYRKIRNLTSRTSEKIGIGRSPFPFFEIFRETQYKRLVYIFLRCFSRVFNFFSSFSWVLNFLLGFEYFFLFSVGFWTLTPKMMNDIEK